MRHACDEVLRLDANNIKALFRRGQASLALGEIENALKDFNRIHELEPENKAAINQITICKHKIKEHTEREKKMYAGMFDKFAKIDQV